MHIFFTFQQITQDVPISCSQSLYLCWVEFIHEDINLDNTETNFSLQRFVRRGNKRLRVHGACLILWLCSRRGEEGCSISFTCFLAMPSPSWNPADINSSMLCVLSFKITLFHCCSTSSSWERGCYPVAQMWGIVGPNQVAVMLLDYSPAMMHPST